MQDAAATPQRDGRSIHVTGFEKHVAQKDTERENVVTQQGFSEDSLAAAAAAAVHQAMQHRRDMEVEKHGSIEIGQQIGDVEFNKDGYLAGSNVDKNGEKRADMRVEGDGGHLAGNGAQVEELFEEISIQEDDLLKTVIEVLEARHLIETRPLPVLVKGKEVDLLKLCVQVRACGGYDRVTLWSSISKSLGFGQECGPLLKLVYVKYLKGLENRRLVASQVVQGTPDILKRESEDAAGVKSESVKAQSKNRGITSAKKRSNEEGPAVENSVVEHSSAMSAEGSDSLIGVLEWMKRLALNPGDPKKGQGVRVSRWSEAWAGKCETLAGRVRAVLWNKEDHHPLHDLSPPETQDQAHDRKKRGRGIVPQGIGGSIKKSRRLSS